MLRVPSLLGELQVFTCLDLKVSEPFLSLLISLRLLNLHPTGEHLIAHLSFGCLHPIKSFLLPLSQHKALFLGLLLILPLNPCLLLLYFRLVVSLESLHDTFKLILSLISCFFYA